MDILVVFTAKITKIPRLSQTVETKIAIASHCIWGGDG